MFGMGQSTETDSRVAVARVGVQGAWGHRLFFGEDEKVLEMDSGDGCATTHVLDATESHL